MYKSNTCLITPPKNGGGGVGGAYSREGSLFKISVDRRVAYSRGGANSRITELYEGVKAVFACTSSSCETLVVAGIANV